MENNINSIVMKKIVVSLLSLIVVSCIETNPNLVTEKTIESQTLHYLESTTRDSVLVSRKMYVPIYSNIYRGTRSERTMLTATLSIRNTSEVDSLFVSRIDYFNTQGGLVRKYLKKDIYLDPMETIDYVIEERDTLGGSGANFIVEWYGEEHLTPIIQAVMIGGLASKVFSFTTEGSPVNN